MNYVKDAFIAAVCQRANIDDNVFNFEGRWIETSSNDIYPARGTFADVINEAGLIGDAMYKLISRRTPTVDIDIINDCSGFSIPYCSPSLRLDMIWDKFRTTGDTMTLGEKFTFTDPNVGSHEANSYFISSKEVNSSGFQYIEPTKDDYCGALVQFTHSDQIGQDHKHYRMLIKDDGGDDLMLYRWLVIKIDGSTKDVVRWYRREGPKSPKMVKYNATDSKEVEHQPPIELINEIQYKDSKNPSIVYPFPTGYEDPYAGNEEIKVSHNGIYYFDGSSNRIKFLPEDFKARVVPKEEYENRKVDASFDNVEITESNKRRRKKPGHVRDEVKGVPCGDGDICDPDTGIDVLVNDGNGVPCGDGDICDPDTGINVVVNDGNGGNGVPCGDGDICDPDTGIGNGVQSDNVEITKSNKRRRRKPGHVRDEEKGVPCGDGDICDPDTGIGNGVQSDNVEITNSNTGSMQQGGVPCGDGGICDPNTGSMQHGGVPCGDGDICDPNTESVKSRVKSRKRKKNKKNKKHKKISSKPSKASTGGRKHFLNHGKRTPHESL